MSTRISSIGFAVLLLAACGQGHGDGLNVAEAEALAQGDRPLPCRTGGDAGLRAACVTERSQGPDGPILTIRHPDGGFRRFNIVSDGRGVVPADGAEEAKVSIVENNMIEVAVGNDLYRLPATIAAGGN